MNNENGKLILYVHSYSVPRPFLCPIEENNVHSSGNAKLQVGCGCITNQNVLWLRK